MKKKSWKVLEKCNIFLKNCGPIQGFFVLILNFLAICVAFGLTDRLLPSHCSTSTQLITLSIRGWGTFLVSPLAVPLDFFIPISRAFSRKSINQFPASVSICLPNFIVLLKLLDNGFLFSSFSPTASGCSLPSGVDGALLSEDNLGVRIWS